jgi:hypothetical protein
MRADEASERLRETGLAGLFVFHITGDEAEQLTGERQHVSFGEAARAELSVNVLGEDLNRSRIGFGAWRGYRRRLRHNWNFCPLTIEPDASTYPRMMPNFERADKAHKVADFWAARWTPANCPSHRAAKTSA